MKSQFDNCAQEYHNFRPEYPAELFQLLIDHFALTENSIIVDVGCGTARAALPLATRCARVIGIDTSLEMMRFGDSSARAANAPIAFVAASAESLPLRAGAAQFINCAQAFHWFNAQPALSEFARVLKPAGGLAIYWNYRDEHESPFLADFEQLILKYNPAHQSAHRKKDWGAEITRSNLFYAVEFHTFHHSPKYTVEEFIGLAQSISYIRNALDPAVMLDFQEELRALLMSVIEDGLITLPYKVFLWCAQKT